MEGGDVIIAHAIRGASPSPVNLFFSGNEAEVIAAAGRDYGQSIKDLAASNIFPGDLLTKNFGVTRHGACLLHYDELVSLPIAIFAKAWKRGLRKKKSPPNRGSPSVRTTFS